MKEKTKNKVMMITLIVILVALLVFLIFYYFVHPKVLASPLDGEEVSDLDMFLAQSQKVYTLLILAISVVIIAIFIVFRRVQVVKKEIGR